MPDDPARLTALRAAMEETGTDLVALGPGPHMHWVLGFHPHPDERPCLLLVTRRDAAMLMPALNAEEAQTKTDLPLHLWADDDGPEYALSTALAAVGGGEAGHVAVDEAMRADFALLLLDAVPNAHHTYAAETVGELRLRKDAAEIAALKMNAGIADCAMAAARNALKPGVTEREVAAAARATFADEGAAPLFTIVGAGGNGAFPHHATGDTPIRPGQPIVMDIGARRGDFSSDITRMACIGEPPEGYAEVHAVVEAAVQAALAAAKPGVKAKAVDKAARDTIAAAGYGDYFVHRTGHGMGLEGHEPPWITATSDTTLAPGMVFSIEPGIYLPGRFGIRLEEIVVLHDDGPEILSGLPRELYVA